MLKKYAPIARYTCSRLVNTNKKVDFEVDFDDEKTRQQTAEQSIIKNESIKTQLFETAKVLKFFVFFIFLQICLLIYPKLHILVMNNT